jgi:hypothetical protein
MRARPMVQHVRQMPMKHNTKSAQRLAHHLNGSRIGHILSRRDERLEIPQ